MAVVTSLTVEKIQELMAGYSGIALSQEELLILIQQLLNEQESNNQEVEDFKNRIIPKITQDVEDANNAVSELNETTIVNIMDELDDAKIRLDGVLDVELPSLREDVANEIINSIERPKVYVQDTAPEDPDEEERYLVVGDVWFNSSDNNRQLMWNGVEWANFAIDIPDFSLTVKKLISPRHQLY